MMKHQNRDRSRKWRRWRIRLLPIIGALALSFALSATAPTAHGASQLTISSLSSSGDWPMYLDNIQHSSYNRYETVITPSSAKNLKLHWTYTQTTTISV